MLFTPEYQRMSNAKKKKRKKEEEKKRKVIYCHVVLVV